ncbi:mitochondrial ATP synthase epsilon chain-domain-containing protein [Armillaria mellea]|nr:mitochondrial ATP synthase epsilon chain-domain-containing protein [Armillaria mellea]
MSTAWRSVFSFNKYSEIAARAVRASLKEDQRVLAEKRGLTALRYQKWENGQGGQQVCVLPLRRGRDLMDVQVLLKPEAETK